MADFKIVLKTVLTRRTFLVAAIFVVVTTGFGILAPQAFADVTPIADADPSGQYYVEFLVGDRTDETRKWGHVSLRVVGPGKVDNIYDFGRYGKMWGMKDATEGEPILRVWKPAGVEPYRLSHLKDGGTTKRYHFVSNKWRNEKILAYYDRMTSGAKRLRSSKERDIYNSNYKSFHAVEVNCTTVAIDAFMEGFPYNLNSMRYATARTLQFYMRGYAEEHIFDKNAGRWTHIWWPLDLMALLDEQYVAKGLATSLPL